MIQSEHWPRIMDKDTDYGAAIDAQSNGHMAC